MYGLIGMLLKLVIYTLIENNSTKLSSYTEMANANTAQWLQRLQSFLNTLLQPIVKDPTQRNRYLDANAMSIWALAFTHETVSPSDNYEDLEYLGDAMLKAAFPKYLMKRFPYLHKGEYTELNVAYMSKMMQAELARRMGLGEYIRVKGIERAILNLETDVFESFFGALDTISDSITPGLGFANCYNMIVHIFQTVEIDEEKGRGSAKTRVQQIFTRFDQPKPQETVDENDKFNVRFTITLTPDNVQFLRSYGVEVGSPAIGYGQGATRTEASFEAYASALSTLANHGITTEWAEEAKQVRDFSDPAITPYVAKASERLKREGFDTMYFFIPRKTVTTKGAIVQLVGVRANGQHEVLSYTYTTDRDNSYRTAKTLVVSQYASGQ